MMLSLSMKELVVTLFFFLGIFSSSTVLTFGSKELITLHLRDFLCVEIYIHVLFSGFMRLDERARQDVAIIGSGFLKLDGKFKRPF